MEALPKTPKGIRILKPIEAEYLNATSAAGQWRTPKDCATCDGTGTFRWYSSVPGHDDELVDWKCDCVEQWILHR